MIETSKIKEHMEVSGSDAMHVGTVDCVKGDQLILTKSDPGAGGKHHALPLEWISDIEGNEVILNQPAERAQKFWLDVDASELKGVDH